MCFTNSMQEIIDWQAKMREKLRRFSLLENERAKLQENLFYQNHQQNTIVQQYQNILKKIGELQKTDTVQRLEVVITPVILPSREDLEKQIELLNESYHKALQSLSAVKTSLHKNQIMESKVSNIQFPEKFVPDFNFNDQLSEKTNLAILDNIKEMTQNKYDMKNKIRIIWYENMYLHFIEKKLQEQLSILITIAKDLVRERKWRPINEQFEPYCQQPNFQFYNDSFLLD